MSERKTNNLAVDVLREYLDYDQNTGVFTWRKRHPRTKYLLGKQTGSEARGGYIKINLFKVTYAAHRLAWIYVTGRHPKKEIDHINGDRKDNRFCNLRESDRSQNQENQRRAMVTNKAGLLGVRTYNNRNIYGASICVKGNRIFLGCFKDKRDAHAAYLDAKRRLHEGCTI